MPKAYIISRVTVHDAEAYGRYAAFASVAMKKYGARVLARGGRSEALEGEARPRNVLLEFDDYKRPRPISFAGISGARTHCMAWPISK